MSTLRVACLTLTVAILMTGCKGPGQKQKTTGADSSSDTAAQEAVTPLVAYEAPDASECEGRPVETITEFYADGTKAKTKEVVKLDDGTTVAHGTTMFFYPEIETKKTQIEFVCGVRHGPKHAWYGDGSKWQEGAYYNGKDHGTWTVWDIEGNKVQQYTVIHGAWTGMYTEWWDNGQKKREVEFINGLKQGAEIHWDSFGNEVRRIEYIDSAPQPMATPTGG